ncbi:MAG TPA: hypothetical protein PKC70_12240, partial [Cellvibrionaceae bacterium]|nr:hypothetical protein [Cellvibrionaceae bacterium]
KEQINNPEIDVVVINLPDDKKGEKLIALHEAPLDTDNLRQQLQAAGLNPLAIPGQWCLVAQLPKLGSGKTDFSAAKKLAEEAAR